MSGTTATFTRSSLAQAFKYCRVAPAAIWIQDYFLTLDDEVQFMVTAKQRWKLVRLLFMITRYLPIMDFSMTLYVVTLNPTEAYKCYPLYSASGVTFLITMLASEGLLFIRTSILWYDSRRTKFFIAIMFGALVIIAVVLLAGVFISLGYYSSPTLDISNCLSLDMNPSDTMGLVPFAIFELMVCALTAYRAIRHCRSTQASKLLKALCQGNLVYTVALLFTTVANISVLVLVRSNGQSASLNQMQLVLHSVLASRILFDLRSTDDRAQDHECMSVSALRFASSPARVDAQVDDVGRWETDIGA